MALGQMKRRALFAAGIGLALVMYPALSFWPYEWHGARFVFNAAEQLPSGGLEFPEPGVALGTAAQQWLQPAMDSHRLEILLRVRTRVSEQFGPARILTFSRGPHESNLMIGQDGADLVVRLRTAWTDATGRIDSEPIARVQDLFLTPDWVDLRILIEPERLRIAVGDEPLIDTTLPSRPLETWTPSYGLALGNEVTYNRPWEGAIQRALVRAGGIGADYAQASELRLPGAFLITTKFPKLVPFRQLNPRDAAENVIFYLPLGLLFGVLLGTSGGGWRHRRVVGALFLLAAVSAGMETLQVFVPRRAPSIDDLIFNTLGGGLGLLLAWWWMERRFGRMMRA